jgi:hypothetical protein
VLTMTDLCFANLRHARLNGANLSGAFLFGADLHKADLREADLTGADLTGVRLKAARFLDVRLGDVIVPQQPPWTPARRTREALLDKICLVAADIVLPNRAKQRGYNVEFGRNDNTSLVVVRAEKRRWQIVHRATGQPVGPSLRILDDVIDLLSLLLPLTDWIRPEPPSEEDATRIRIAISRYLDSEMSG